MLVVWLEKGQPSSGGSLADLKVQNFSMVIHVPCQEVPNLQLPECLKSHKLSPMNAEIPCAGLLSHNYLLGMFFASQHQYVLSYMCIAFW